MKENVYQTSIGITTLIVQADQLVKYFIIKPPVHRY